MKTDETYNQMIQLLETINNHHKIPDFCFAYGYQIPYIKSLLNKEVREETGKPRKGNMGSNKEITKFAERFIKTL